MWKRFQRWVTYIQDYQNVSTNAYIASVVFAYVSTVRTAYETCSRRLSDNNCQQLISFLARRYTNYIMQHVTRQVALWSANMQVADAFRKKNEFYPFFSFFFLGDFCSMVNNSDQWNTERTRFLGKMLKLRISTQFYY